jgi:hypothetical protein
LLPVIAVPRVVRLFARGEGGRPENLNIGIEKHEGRRQHADDLVRLAAQPQILPHRIVAAAKSALPEAVREDDDFFLPEFALRLGKELAAQRLCAQRAEKRWRDGHGLDALRLRESGTAQRDAGLAEERRLFERRHVAFAIEVIGHAVGAFGQHADARVLVEDADEPVRLGERQRF